MKKNATFLIVAFLLGLFNAVNAQQVVATNPDCEALVAPRYANNLDVYNSLVPEKVEWCCTYAANSFYLTNRVPEGVELHDISELVVYATGQHLPQGYVVDLNTFSFFAYNVSDFWAQNHREAVCFTVGNQDHRYLVLRSGADIANRVEDAFANHTTNSRPASGNDR